MIANIKRMKGFMLVEVQIYYGDGGQWKEGRKEKKRKIFNL
jgi:hypothetical protein